MSDRSLSIALLAAVLLALAVGLSVWLFLNKLSHQPMRYDCPPAKVVA